MISTDYPHIRFDVEPNGVATLTFNLPRMANAMDLLGVQETLDALRRCEKRSDIGAVVLTGAGDHAFSAGFNLKEIPFADWKPEQIHSHFETLAMWWHQVIAQHRPLAAAGPRRRQRRGGGRRTGDDARAPTWPCAVDSATLLGAWHSIGLANDAATSYTLVKIVGFRRAMELMLTNRTLTAAEALDWQILNRVVLAGRLSSRTLRALPRTSPAGPTHLQAMAKSALPCWLAATRSRSATEMEIENVMESIADPHFKKTLDQFLSKQTRSDRIQVGCLRAAARQRSRRTADVDSRERFHDVLKSTGSIRLDPGGDECWSPQLETVISRPASRDPERQAGRRRGLPLGLLSTLSALARTREAAARRHQEPARPAQAPARHARGLRREPEGLPALGRLLSHLAADLDPGRVAALHDRWHDGRAPPLSNDALRPGPGRLAFRPGLLGHGRASW